MTQLESLTRHILIVKKLRKSKRATFKEINNYLKDESIDQELNLSCSTRTFQRDIKVIFNIFGITIKCGQDRLYFIESEIDTDINERLIEAFEVVNALKFTEQNRKHIYLEKRTTSGTEHLALLFKAIKKKHIVSFNYFKSYEGEITKKIVKPLALKEYRHRWYLVARDEKENDKRYALDRISHLQIKETHFQEISGLDIDQMHTHCFGITIPPDYQVHKVVLSFSPHEGKYHKSLPLHPSQKVLIDDNKEFRISLDIYITFDFIMELLSLGDTVKVIEPQSLIQEIKEIYRKALEQY
ncbi:MAG: WYL domain-containing protein [Bacteroidales bacterium]|jgi:predicted DNA-binding transcriptional regulator YafY|nr:WYL domain-containing protein [Bacteroidales bacterium]